MDTPRMPIAGSEHRWTSDVLSQTREEIREQFFATSCPLYYRYLAAGTVYNNIPVAPVAYQVILEPGTG